MRTKVLVRNIGIIMIILAVGITAYSFVGDSNKIEKVAKETEAPESKETEGSSTEDADTTKTPSTDEATETPEAKVTELPADHVGEEKIKDYTLEVTEGMSASDIADELESNGIVKDADEFAQVLENKGVSEDINVGSYDLTSDNTYDQIINDLTGKQK